MEVEANMEVEVPETTPVSADEKEDGTEEKRATSLTSPPGRISRRTMDHEP